MMSRYFFYYYLCPLNNFIVKNMVKINFRQWFVVMLFGGFITLNYPVYAQLPAPGEKIILDKGWIARRANEVRMDGNRLTSTPWQTEGWMPARVPGTALTTLLENHIFPNPEYSMNNELIPDIYHIGKDYYTFWYVTRFKSALPQGKHVWLNFRGINYKADIFLNGKRINTDTHEGMFLREQYDVSEYLQEENVLAVLVYPPDYPGNPNGGQGGDGLIARNNTMQFTPGWDWIQPVRDRNTGIWDEVSLTVTGNVRVQHPYVVTKVQGVRHPEGVQKDAAVKTTVELENLSDASQNGTLVYETNGIKLTQAVSLLPHERKLVALKDITVKQPRLWWPNGIGRQELYDMRISFTLAGQTSDDTRLRYGIREITTDKCPDTGGRRFYVNGQKIFITGGNYIASDWLLRLSPERYRAEIRYHAEMNVRMIRVWGGALLERPDFYDLCDEYGILVFQDLWGSGDCNGAWTDPAKLESRERRWEYPDNHRLFIASAEDQVKMIRNHPSLCLWCGANEWPLAKDIDKTLKEELFPRLDPERLFISYSTDTLFTRNTIGNVGDGPYGIQEPEWFFTFRSTPFNPEAGSVGTPEIESMREMMSEEELAEFPRYGKRGINPVWMYHKELGYNGHLERYGKVTDIETYCKYAQAVNYNQYRSFMEGWASHIWEWYTGILIWKTQNPWTSLRGQMYDWYLDVNASLYGTRKGCEPLHPQYNLVTRQIEVVNSSLNKHDRLTLTAQVYKTDGTKVWEQSETVSIDANTVKRTFTVPEPPDVQGVYFLKLSLGAPLSYPSNIYWLTTKEKDYTGLADLPDSQPSIKADIKQTGAEYAATLHFEAGKQISFFNRIKVFDGETGKRILPVHYSDNYISLMPGDRQDVSLSFSASIPAERIQIVVDSWTHPRTLVQLGR
jgi:hypothetical protein